MTHTPGPWKAHGNGIEAIGSVDTIAGVEVWSRIATAEPTTVSDSEGRRWVTTGTAEDNARLIGASPDLLEALEGLCVVVGKMKPASGEPYGRAVAELIEARTVIAKARGQS